MKLATCLNYQSLVPFPSYTSSSRRAPRECAQLIGSSFLRVHAFGSGPIFLYQNQSRRHAPILPRSSGLLVTSAIDSSHFALAIAIATFSVAIFNHVLSKNPSLNNRLAKSSKSARSDHGRKIFEKVIYSWISDSTLPISRGKDFAGETRDSIARDAFVNKQPGSLVYQCSMEGVPPVEFPASISNIFMGNGQFSQAASGPQISDAFAFRMCAKNDAQEFSQSFFETVGENEREDLYTFYGDSGTDILSDSGGLRKKTSSMEKKKVKLYDKNKRSYKTTDKSSIDETSIKREKPSRSLSPRTEKEGMRVSEDKITKQRRLSSFSEPWNRNEDPDTNPFEIYNNLLRVGRLSECMDVLETLERKGELDMSKVYHAEFFKRCKGKNSLQDALRFFKLIPNPSMSTFNMLMSVCASSQDADGAFQVLGLLQESGMKADCKLYTTLISTCAKSGKVDTMFEVFHEMINSGIEPNVHTYGALIDGCARVGQVAKAFGAYGMMRSKNVKPDRVVYNALISACGQSGAVDRAFDVLEEMAAETHPIEPNHVTIGALMMACAKAGQVHRAHEVYNLIRKYNIKGTPEMYTIAVNCCSQTGDWNLACLIYDDMIERGVTPDEIFFSALIDVAGHAGKVDAAFDILKKARNEGSKLGIIPYSSLMGACCNSKSWQKALELYKDIKDINLRPTVPTVNALITALCNGDQLSKAIEILSEMKSIFGLTPNTVTYSVLVVACERKGDLKAGAMLLSQAKEDGVSPSLVMYKCVIAMCVNRFEKACAIGETVLSTASGPPKIEYEWTSLALRVYREAIANGQKPTVETLSQVLGCLKLPWDASLKSRLVENLGITVDQPRSRNISPLLDGFGEYDPRAFFLLEEAASFGIVPYVSFKSKSINIDAKQLPIHVAEVYLLTILRGLKHRLAAGGKLPNVTLLLPMEKTVVVSSRGGKQMNLATRNGQLVGSLLRRIGIPYQGNESRGAIRINGISLRRWLQPRVDPPSPLYKKPDELGSSLTRIGRIISDQQRSIRTGNLSLD